MALILPVGPVSPAIGCAPGTIGLSAMSELVYHRVTLRSSQSPLAAKPPLVAAATLRIADLEPFNGAQF